MLFLQELLVLSSGDLLLFWSGEAGDGGSGDRGSGDGGVSGIYECVATFTSGTNITMATFQVELDSGKTDQWYLRPCLFSLPSSVSLPLSFFSLPHFPPISYSLHCPLSCVDV